MYVFCCSFFLFSCFFLAEHIPRRIRRSHILVFPFLLIFCFSGWAYLEKDKSSHMIVFLFSVFLVGPVQEGIRLLHILFLFFFVFFWLDLFKQGYGDYMRLCLCFSVFLFFCFFLAGPVQGGLW